MVTKKGSSKKRTSKKASKRELIDTGTDKRFMRRGKKGRFKESDDVTKSLRSDVQQHSKNVVQSGYGDLGDQKPRKAAANKSAKKAGKKATKKRASKR